MEVFSSLAVRIFCDGSYTHARRIFNAEEYKRLKLAERIIVFGAGHVAKDTIALLVRLRFYEFTIAVSEENKKMTIGGKRIFPIRELSKYAKQSIVVIAVSSKYSCEMEHIARSFGFSNIIKIAKDS